MRLVDTDSKGKVIFQTSSGAYFAIPHAELESGLKVFTEAKNMVENGCPRIIIDSRRNN